MLNRKTSCVVQRKEELDLLTFAFQNFTKATETLKQSYQKLQQKVTELSRELSETNKALARKVTELKRVKTYLNNILDSMMDGLFALDLEGKITIFNTAAEKITNYKAKDVLGKSYKDVFADNKHLVSLLEKALKEKKSVIGEKRFSSKNKDIFLEVIANPVKSLHNEVEGIMVILKDISILRHLQEEIRHKEKLAMLGEMAASVAHEVRNPLSGIEGFALLLKEGLKEDKEKSLWVEHIIKGARSLNNLVTNLLNFSRPLKPCFRPVVVNELVDAVICLIRQKIEREKREVVFIKDFPSSSVDMVADPDLLKQAFLNLILNSVEAMPDGGKVTVRIRKKKYSHSRMPQFVREINGDYILGTTSEEVLIEFSDTGCGILPEEKEKIFHPFYTTKSKGSGLGLSVVRQIVQIHGGKIRVESVPGRGTTFVLNFPLINDSEEVKNDGRKYSCSRR